MECISTLTQEKVLHIVFTDAICARKLTLVSFLSTLPGFVKSYFDTLYDEEIITEISFITWESSMEEEPGKGVTVMAASEFFRWLRSATEENDEES